MRRIFVAITVVLLLLTGGGYWYSQSNISEGNPTTEQIELVAVTSGCHGASCNGQNPTGTCDDGITVATRDVRDGILELRYSPSCESNWGRYTPYWNTAWGYTASDIILTPRVTAWSPGGKSVDAANIDNTWHQFGSSWSQMVDGTKETCTGVELTYSGEGWKSNGVEAPTGWEDEKVWQWGPCY